MCSVLQCVAVCCSVLQCVAVCCSVLQCVAVCCSVFTWHNAARRLAISRFRNIHVTHLSMSHHAHEPVVVSHNWKSHVAQWVMSHNESCHTMSHATQCAMGARDWMGWGVMSRIRRVMPYIWTSHVTNMKGSCHRIMCHRSTCSCDTLCSNYYGVAMISRLLENIGLFCKIQSSV